MEWESAEKSINLHRLVILNATIVVIDGRVAFTGGINLAAKSGVDVRIITPHIWDKALIKD